jgi:hypothetical protein
MTSDDRQMSEARQVLRSGNLEVNADILKQRVLDTTDTLTQQDVRNAIYICYCCNTRVRPVAIGLCHPGTTKRYKNKPHFALFKDEFHEDGCEYLKQTSDSEVNIDSKRIERLRLDIYPSCLSLNWLNSLGNTNNITGKGTYGFNIEEEWEDSNSFKDWAPSHIQPLVKHFLEHKNRSSRLIVPNVHVKTYDRVFERIYFIKNFTQSNLRIYFSQFIYRKIIIKNNVFTFFLTDGNYEKDSSTPVVRSRLVIDARHWKASNTRNLIEKISKLRIEANQLRCEGNLQKGKSLPWIFFLGYVCPENDSSPRLLCDDLRLVEICVTNKLNNIPEIPPYYLWQAEHSNASDNSDDLELNDLSLGEEDNRVQSRPHEFDNLRSSEVQEIIEQSFDDHETTSIGDYVEPSELNLQRPALNVDFLETNHPEPDSLEIDIGHPDSLKLDTQRIDEVTRQTQRRVRTDEDLTINPRSEEFQKIRAPKPRPRKQKHRHTFMKKALTAVQRGIRNYVKPLIRKLIQFLKNH